MHAISTRLYWAGNSYVARSGANKRFFRREKVVDDFLRPYSCSKQIAGYHVADKYYISIYPDRIFFHQLLPFEFSEESTLDDHIDIAKHILQNMLDHLKLNVLDN